MSAWVLALCCLLSIDDSLVRTTPPSADLAVYLSTDPSQPSAPVEHMERELAALMQAAGYRVVWRDPQVPDKLGLTVNLAVLQLHGYCGMSPGLFRVERSVASGVSLAETFVSAGSVLPFSKVNCANLTRMIGPVLSDAAGAQRDFLYGRAMARVIAHELYHVMIGTRDHGHEGVSKANFTTADLLNESFDFDHNSLAKLRQKAVGSDSHSDDTAIGR